jgi:hypothetical protein
MYVHTYISIPFDEKTLASFGLPYTLLACIIYIDTYVSSMPKAMKMILKIFRPKLTFLTQHTAGFHMYTKMDHNIGFEEKCQSCR